MKSTVLLRLAAMCTVGALASCGGGGGLARDASVEVGVGVGSDGAGGAEVADDTGGPGPDGAASDVSSDVDPTAPTYCGRGRTVAGVTPPLGFCLKTYAQVVEPRSLVVAPNGDVLVAAPSRATPGGATGGPGAIILLADDDHDGVAEQHVFLSTIDATRTLGDVHALALGGGFLYFTTQASVWRTPYTTGQRAATGTPEDLGLPSTFATGGRWTHGLALSPGGELLASRGSYSECSMEPGGEISSVGAGGALTTIAAGFRNPMYMRCHPRDEVCAAMELGEDLAAGAREKMVLLHPGTDYGYPCCYTKGTPTTSTSGLTCSNITQEDASFPLSDTPFGFDWEPGQWPAPYTNGVFVALHGSAYATPSWKGAAIVWAPTSPTTHAPTQDWQTFQGGFGYGGTVLDRPADIAFAPDGRLFFADDAAGVIYWIAPQALMAPAATPGP